MHTAANRREYRREIQDALDNRFLRRTLDQFAVNYRAQRPQVFAGRDVQALVDRVAATRKDAIGRMDELFDGFKRAARSQGVTVHLAETARRANEIIGGIALDAGAEKVVKAKSMTAEEILLNRHLEQLGLTVTETDLGEWIVQLRGESPTHMVLPAIHLSRNQVADLFSGVTGQKQPPEIERLVKVARRELRQRFAEADLGVTGANFALADSGTLGLVTNEGNARLAVTLPKVHVALIGLDKLLPGLPQALDVLEVLPRNATGQQITSYVSWITGSFDCGASITGRKQRHVVFLDNGRRALAADPVMSEVLRCVRCGACANVCPVYRLIGGRHYGHIYIGAIGLILTYFYHGRDTAVRNLVENCLSCQACREVCVAGIDLPHLIKTVEARIKEDRPRIEDRGLDAVLPNRRLFHGLLRAARIAQKPLTGPNARYLRHLPNALLGEHDFRQLPALADRPFRDRWPQAAPPKTDARARAALFAGCLQDFVYPEQLEAGVRVLDRLGLNLSFPPDQSCCGLPAHASGRTETARRVAAHNLDQFDPAAVDHVVTLCASCGGFLKNEYPRLFEAGSDRHRKALALAAKVIDFASLADRYWPEGKIVKDDAGPATAYHAPCHLRRGLGVVEPPRRLIDRSGCDYRPAPDEDVCCGCGGAYSVKFPEISEQTLKRKLGQVQGAGARVLATDCPGCVMQLRGGAAARGLDLRVMHTAELLADRIDQP